MGGRDHSCGWCGAGGFNNDDPHDEDCPEVHIAKLEAALREAAGIIDGLLSWGAGERVEQAQRFVDENRAALSDTEDK